MQRLISPLHTNEKEQQPRLGLTPALTGRRSAQNTLNAGRFVGVRLD
jgi:hypothetical protein